MKIKELLQEIEWGLIDARSQQPCCPLCIGRKDDGHEPGCKLAEAVKIITAVPAMDDKDDPVIQYFNEIESTLKDDWKCDHDVGVCWCGFHQLCERAMIQYQAVKTQLAIMASQAPAPGHPS